MNTSGPAAPFGRVSQDTLYDKIKDKPLHVDLVILHKGRTRPYIIEKELLRIRGTQSLDELKEKLLEAQQSLEALNIFQAVQLVLKESLTVSNTCSLLGTGILKCTANKRSICRVMTNHAH